MLKSYESYGINVSRKGDYSTSIPFTLTEYIAYRVLGYKDRKIADFLNIQIDAINNFKSYRNINVTTISNIRDDLDDYKIEVISTGGDWNFDTIVKYLNTVWFENEIYTKDSLPEAPKSIKRNSEMNVVNVLASIGSKSLLSRNIYEYALVCFEDLKKQGKILSIEQLKEWRSLLDEK